MQLRMDGAWCDHDDSSLDKQFRRPRARDPPTPPPTAHRDSGPPTKYARTAPQARNVADRGLSRRLGVPPHAERHRELPAGSGQARRCPPAPTLSSRARRAVRAVVGNAPWPSRLRGRILGPGAT
jgi:hypothetical protein